MTKLNFQYIILDLYEHKQQEPHMGGRIRNS